MGDPIARAAQRLGALVAVVLGCAAQPVAAQSLSEAVDQAYAGNPTLRAARAGLAAVDERYVQARAGYGPQATATVGDVAGVVTGPNIVGSSAAAGLSAGLTLNQPLYTGGRVHAAIGVAEAEILQQRESLRRTEQEVLTSVVSAFLAVRRDGQLLAAYRDNLEALERQLRQTRAEFAVRRVTQTDVDQAQGRVSLAQADLAQAQSQLEISRSLYVQAVGSAPGALAPEPDLPVFDTLQAAQDSAEASNAQVQAARYGEEAGRARLVQAQAAFHPSVNAQLNVARSPIDASGALFIGQTAVTAGVTLSQPLYSSGLLNSTVRQAKADVEVLRAQLDAARLTALQQLSQAWSRLTAARLSIQADAARVTATEAAFYGVRREHPFDLRTSLEVLNAEQELNNAQARLLSDRYSEYVARVDLLVAAGALNAQTFSQAAPSGESGDAHLDKLRRGGGPPWTSLVHAVDRLGAKPLTPLGPVQRDGTAVVPVSQLPPPPPPARDIGPLRTATSIMDADTAEAKATQDRAGGASGKP